MSKKYDNPYNYIKKTSKLYDTVITVYAMEYKIFKCPECEKEIEVTTMSRPRRGRKPGSINTAPLTNPIPPKSKEKEDDLNIENIDLDSNEETIEDDTVLIEEETDIDSAVDVGIKPPEDKEEF